MRESLDAWVDQPDLPAEGDLHAETRHSREVLREKVLRWRAANGPDADPEGTTALDLSRCWLRRIPPVLGTLHNLSKLDLGANELVELPPEICGLAHLRTLKLGGNALRELPTAIGELRSLERLGLSDNRALTQLPEEIGSLTRLRVLNADRTSLERLPESIGRLSNLDTLEVTGRRLSELPESLGDLRSLRTLNLGHTSIQRLPASTGRLVDLRTLSLPFAQLAQVPAALGELRNLERLDLDWNMQLADLPPEVIALARTCNVTVHQCPRLPGDVLGQLQAASAERMERTADQRQAAAANLPRAGAGLAVRRQQPVERLAQDPSRGAQTGVAAVPHYVLAERSPRSEEPRAPLSGSPVGRSPIYRHFDPLMWRSGELIGMRPQPPHPNASLASHAPIVQMSQEERALFGKDAQGQPIADADDFFQWVERMRGTADYAADPARTTEKLNHLVEDMWRDPDLRRTCFSMAADAQTDCHDRPAQTFNRMAWAANNAKTLRADIDEKSLVALGTDQYVLQLVEAEATKKMAQIRAAYGDRPGDEIETALRFQTGLIPLLRAEGIQLRLPVQGMLYARASGVRQDELEQAAARITAAYRGGLRKHLLHWSVLADYVNKTYAGEFARLRAGLDAQMERLMEREEAGGTHADTYLEDIAALERDAANPEFTGRRGDIDKRIEQLRERGRDKVPHARTYAEDMRALKVEYDSAMDSLRAVLIQQAVDRQLELQPA